MSLLTNITTKGHFHMATQCNDLQRELLHLFLHLTFLEAKILILLNKVIFKKTPFVSLPVFPLF